MSKIKLSPIESDERVLAALDAGAEGERAAIVAWLRTLNTSIVNAVAGMIERGLHCDSGIETRQGEDRNGLRAEHESPGAARAAIAQAATAQYDPETDLHVETIADEGFEDHARR